MIDPGRARPVLRTPSARKTRAGISVFYWSDEDFGYAIAAKADRDLLLCIAELVYQQTTVDEAKAKLPPIPGKPS